MLCPIVIYLTRSGTESKHVLLGERIKVSASNDSAVTPVIHTFYLAVGQE